MLINFRCPKCGDHRLDEVIVDAVVVTAINTDMEIDPETPIVHGESVVMDGSVFCYRCHGCLEKIALDEDDLIRYLNENDMVQ